MVVDGLSASPAGTAEHPSASGLPRELKTPELEAMPARRRRPRRLSSTTGSAARARSGSTARASTRHQREGRLRADRPRGAAAASRGGSARTRRSGASPFMQSGGAVSRRSATEGRRAGPPRRPIFPTGSPSAS